MNEQINKLLTEIGIGRITPSAYDTAWIARLQSQMPEQSSAALDWLRANQLPDGSWGASEFFYYHDRMACTLSAITALQQADADEDKCRIHKGLDFLVKNSKKMDLNPVGATVGFEMIAPTLLEDVQTNGFGNILSLNGKGAAARQRKLKNIPSHMISRHTTMAHSAEMVGNDGKHIIDWDDLLEENGSVGFSPAATCYFIMSRNQGTQKAVKHLTNIFQDGSLPTVSSIDLFETTWGLWNFQVAYPSLDPSLISHHLDFIEAAWTEVGTSFAAGYTPKDGDDSSMAYDVLVRGGRNPDLSVVLHYEDESVFRCYANESDPSISTNVHVLGALQQAGMECNHQSVQKTINYLREKQHPDGWWLDKWHTSPYYPTTHFVITGAGYCAQDMVSKAVSWIANTQNKNGSWGYIIPTAEETAYSLQALAHYKRLGYPVDTHILERGKSWLLEHQEEIYTPLWVGKSLYSPVRVVASTVLSALVMVDDC